MSQIFIEHFIRELYANFHVCMCSMELGCHSQENHMTFYSGTFT